MLPPLHTPEPTPPPQRRIDKIANAFIVGVFLLITIGIVATVAFVGIPLPGGWVLHSVWIAIIAGVIVGAIVAAVLQWIAKLVGLRVTFMDGKDDAK